MKKIRNHRKLQPAYLIILGDEEVEQRPSPASRNGIKLQVSLSTVSSPIVAEIKEKTPQPSRPCC